MSQGRLFSRTAAQANGNIVRLPGVDVRNGVRYACADEVVDPLTATPLYLGRGDFFAHYCVLSNSELNWEHPATVIAEKSSLLLAISRKGFQEALSQCPDLVELLGENIRNVQKAREQSALLQRTMDDRDGDGLPPPLMSPEAQHFTAVGELGFRGAEVQAKRDSAARRRESLKSTLHMSFRDAGKVVQMGVRLATPSSKSAREDLKPAAADAAQREEAPQQAPSSKSSGGIGELAARLEAIEKRSIRMEKLNHRVEAMLLEMDRRWVEHNPLDR